MTRTLTAILLLALCACERLPDSYPPPEQRQPAEDSRLAVQDMLLEMDSPSLSEHIVKDVYGKGDASWRWTGQEPTFKVLAYSAVNIKLSADFAIWAPGFKQTGPLELAFLVNGHVLDTVRYTSPGQKHFEKAVPQDWLRTDIESTVAIRVGKLYVSPSDGAKFGIILTRIGFAP
ncbi:MAG: hypothetical protein LAP38_01100 [Acidobacteriia bacterium]|nr:hypothetical protein [Terriglobia bacterium]